MGVWALGEGSNKLDRDAVSIRLNDRKRKPRRLPGRGVALVITCRPLPAGLPCEGCRWID